MLKQLVIFNAMYILKNKHCFLNVFVRRLAWLTDITLLKIKMIKQ